MFCSACGTKNHDDGNFCKQCGDRLDKAPAGKITEQDFERAMPEDEQVAALLERAYRARKDGDRQGAIALCQQALELKPGSTSCHSLLGQLYEQGSERDLAIEQYEQVLKLNPGSIADRVKLDELRGEVPSLVTQPRTPPHVVLAHSRREPVSMDYRMPAFVLAGIALMVLGGIFTMQFMSRQNSQTRSRDSGTQIASSGTTQQPNSGGGAGQPSQTSAQSQSGQPTPGAGQPNSSPDFNTMIPQGPPIIIKTPPETRYYPVTGPAAVTADTQPKGGPPPNHSTGNSDGGKDFGGEIVHLDAGAGQPAEAPPNKSNSITIHPPGSENGASNTASPPGSDSRKNVARADNLAQQGNFRAAGNMYIQALDGAGEDTAYIYRRAGWCLEQAGDKAAAVGYYQHGIDEARKLVVANHQVEIANNLIKECQTGIKACSN